MQKIINWGFYLFVFLLPWQTRWLVKTGELNNDFWEYGTFSLYATDILFLLTLFLFVAWRIDKGSPPDKTRVSKFSFSLLALLLVALLSTFWASNQPLAWYGFFKLAEGLLLFWLLLSANFIKTRNIILVFIMGVVVQSFLAVWQFLLQNTFASKWLGLAYQLPGELGVSAIEALDSRWLRAYGALPHPNILAGFLVIGLLLLIGLAFLAKERYQKLFVLAGFVFTAMALFFTFSRGAFLGLLVGLVIYGLTAVRSKNKIIRKRTAVLFLLLIIVFSSLAFIFKEPFITRIGVQGRLEIKSVNERMSYYQQAGELLKSNWYRGTGINSYTLAVKEQIDENLPAYSYQPVHNVYVLVFTELSIFGLIIFLYIVYQILLSMYRLLLVHKGLEYSPLLASLGISLVAVFVIMLFDHYFWTLHAGIMLFWLLIGLLLKGARKGS